MKKKYIYSDDTEFLSKIDSLRIQNQWVKITLLDYSDEISLESIEGRIVSGSLTKTGDSAVRRTCSLSCAVDAFKYNPDDIKADYSISKKIYLELGITNETSDYPQEEIIWFPQGVFFITSFTFSASSTGAATINLEFKDKMARLDGTLGGVLPATTRFDTVTSMVNGTPITKKVLVYDLIMEVVHHFGGEDLSNIIIDDIPTKAKRIIRWMGSESVWIYPILSKTNEISYDICFASDLDQKQSAHTPILYNGQLIAAKEYKPNQDIGYMYEDFVYDEELTFDAGTKVIEVLDKIKEWLGNYEFFYDEWGQFHFQEIKNYLNNTKSAYIWEKVTSTNDLDYLYESTQGKAVYVFDDNVNLVSITNTPVYENIKNDFIVEGTITRDKVKYPCRYHLVIDDKPTLTTDGYDNVLVYEDPDSGAITLTKPKIIDPEYNTSKGRYNWLLPEFGEDGKVYGLLEELQTISLDKQISKMEDFAIYYDKLVNEENSLITKDNGFGLTAEVRSYLFALLENYMGYVDMTPYKEQYVEIISTLARQLRRYNVPKQQSAFSTTIDYYESLYRKYLEDISNYGTAITDRISWCGELLQMLYDLFEDIDPNHKPSDRYRDLSYWPAVNVNLSKLWEGISSDDETVLKNLRKARCAKYIDDLRVKKRELEILVEQYTQIINNYNVQIAVYDRQPSLTPSDSEMRQQLIVARDRVQLQVDNYKAELEVGSQRLTILYSILTALGAPDRTAGETYFAVSDSIPVRVSSFWYYDTNEKNETYGWNKLNWYQYFRNYTQSSKSYYPNDLGGMTYIDYSSIDWAILAKSETTPSMNRYSDWYQNYYVDYAIENELSYFDPNKIDRYVPINWRTELLLMGLQAEENGTDPGYYYQELKANWPTVYDFQKERLIPTTINDVDYFVGNTGVILGNEYQFVTDDFNANNTTKAKFKTKEAEIRDFLLNYENNSYYYFFDMIDSSSPTWGEYSVNNIGRRTNVNVSDSVNCIFAPHIPDYAYINVSGLTMQQRQETYTELSDIAETVIQVTNAFYKNFATGGFKHSAYEQIKYDLQQYTSYQNTVSITAIPCFYLEPNTRVELKDHSTNTFGDYVVRSISIPLGAGNNMSVSMSKAMERI